MNALDDNKYKDRPDFELVGASLDKDAARLRTFLAEEGMPWPQLFAPGKTWENSIAEALEVNAIPSVWIIDRKAVIQAMKAVPVSSEINKVLRSALKGEPQGRADGLPRPPKAAAPGRWVDTCPGLPPATRPARHR